MESESAPNSHLPLLHVDLLQTLHDTGMYEYAQDLDMIQDGQLAFQNRSQSFPAAEEARLWPGTGDNFGQKVHALSEEDLREGESRIAAASAAAENAVTAAEQVKLRQKAAQDAEYGEDGVLYTPSKPRKQSRRGLNRTDFGGRSSNKGLRHFSMKVCEKVEGKGRTTYNEVADELVNDMPAQEASSPGVSLQYDEKNIRRRVYDALNVLMAMDIISREKKEIYWRGLPQGPPLSFDRLRNEKMRLCQKLDQQRRYIADLAKQQATYKSLIARNRNRPMEALPQGGSSQLTALPLPFVLMQVANNATVEIQISEDNRMAHFDFEGQPFKFTGDETVLQEMGLASADDSLTARAIEAAADIPAPRPSSSHAQSQRQVPAQNSAAGSIASSRAHPGQVPGQGPLPMPPQFMGHTNLHIPGQSPLHLTSHPVLHIPGQLAGGFPPGTPRGPGMVGDMGLGMLANAGLAPMQRPLPLPDWQRLAAQQQNGQQGFLQGPSPLPFGLEASFKSPGHPQFGQQPGISSGQVAMEVSPQVMSSAPATQSFPMIPGMPAWPVLNSGSHTRPVIPGATPLHQRPPAAQPEAVAIAQAPPAVSQAPPVIQQSQAPVTPQPAHTALL